ncbi:class I mannose-6-phosphate isomerase [Melghirimyces profundicolus]|uniref:class I mannose-6-phosphate isomerase n=1 Tax=Melghirimyces profundicolus TaxID=1242148 RepID=UPI001FE3DBCF|nr:class I mannose-6-phosphate isomerase [Melghirimyces profundicolus]
MNRYRVGKSNYDKEPFVRVEGVEGQAWQGYPSIIREIRSRLGRKRKTVVTVECYPGVREAEIRRAFEEGLQPVLTIHADEVSYPPEQVTRMIERNLTEDRVFGLMSHASLEEFFDVSKLRDCQKKIAEIENGIILVYGVGASIITQGNPGANHSSGNNANGNSEHILIYADLARWEIQKRYESGEMGNWKADNREEDPLRKYKRGYFFEWRVADRLKKELLPKMDYLLDTNLGDHPKMITREAFREGLKQTVARPFRVVPYFKPGVWGGQWMKEVCDLDRSERNFAWAFDCVPEENSLYLLYGGIRVEVPSVDLVYSYPVELLGDPVHARFGTEFPIRFDFLDTMDGQNLSLQVHPLTEYIQEQFGMHYTQDESYYLLDAEEDAVVYLGLKEGIDPEEMVSDLKRAQDGEIEFPDEKYVNRFPAKKHDHFLIPAGTVHCSGKNSMVLEISATPYIFTFKLWDWGRVDLDGKPRPVHIEHGEKVIQWNRTTPWVEKNLINRVEEVARGDGWREERTGLHEREFIETRRHWFSKKVPHHTGGIVNVLNLVEGEEAVVESPSGAFEPFVVHYAETFIVPAAVGEYTIRPHGPSEGKECVTIKAYVRT